MDIAPQRATHAQRTSAPIALARTWDVALLSALGITALTALAGGAALMVGALVPSAASILTPPVSYLQGTPFSSFLVPGLVLAVVVGGLHTAAFVLGVRRRPYRLVVAAVAGFGLLIWIFVQMVYIPFSFLQALYFAFGILELGLTLLALGILRAAPAGRRDDLV